MHARRLLVSTSALAVFVLLAFGSEVPEDTGAPAVFEDEGVTPPSAEAPPSAPTAAAASPACEPWTGKGQPLSSIEELMDPAKIESMGRKLDLNVECYEIDEYEGDRSLDCNLWNDQWAFDLEVEFYRSSQDAKWQVEDPWVGEAYARQGKWVLSVDAENGTCAKGLMDAMVPPETPLKDYTERRIIDAIGALGWTLGDGGCSVEKYDGEMTFGCPAVKGEGLEASFSLSYELDGGSRIEEERELDSAHASIQQAYGYASCSVSDTASAQNMLKALLQ